MHFTPTPQIAWFSDTMPLEFGDANRYETVMCKSKFGFVTPDSRLFELDSISY